jgi:hypothetical protein
MHVYYDDCIMKLYEIPQNSMILCSPSDGSTYVWFRHVDGYYSFCKTEHNNVAHLCATQGLKFVEERENEFGKYNVYELFESET